MPRIERIFLDDGGVINDNRLRGPQWQLLIAEFFAPRLGGEPGAWAEANKATFEAAFRRMQDRLENWDAATSDYSNEIRRYELDWLRSMCAVLGIELPANEDECFALAMEGERYILPRVHAAFPGAQTAVLELAQAYPLFTASGGSSFELAGTLSGLGLEGAFQSFYGPDLINQPKASPRFYERIFANAGVDPATALVVDDSPRCVAWARQAGAMAVLVTKQAPEGEDFPVIGSLAGLPAVLRRLSNES